MIENPSIDVGGLGQIGLESPDGFRLPTVAAADGKPGEFDGRRWYQMCLAIIENLQAVLDCS